ncbi:MAG: hypothetical protein N3A38_03395 [Planctomycetota bacterium]|nr:hypothetical protein [Planctomycetota bacterium]
MESGAGGTGSGKRLRAGKGVVHMATSRRDTEYVVAVDIGSCSVTCAIGAPRGEEIEVVATASAPSFGISRGEVTDIARAADSVSIAAAEAAGRCGLRIHSVFVTIAAPDLATDVASGSMEMPACRREVRRKDMRRLIERVRDGYPLPEGRAMVSARPVGWSVDDVSRVTDPTSMSATRLGLEMTVVTANGNRLADLRAIIHRAGFYLEGFIPETEACAAGCLSDDERNLGALVVSLGGGSTRAAIVAPDGSGAPSRCRSWPSGGTDMTKALMSRFRIPMVCAERIKREIADIGRAGASAAASGAVREAGAAAGAGSPAQARDSAPPTGRGRVRGGGHGSPPPAERPEAAEEIEVSTIEGQGTRRLALADVAAELRERVVSDLERVRLFCVENSFHPARGAGVVLTGGGASMRGLLPVAAAVFGTQCRIGRPRIGATDDPAMSAVIGTLIRGAEARLAAREGFLKRASDTLRHIAALF